MASPNTETRFLGPELDALDAAFERVPQEHTRPPHGLRELARETHFEHQGRTWPTVMAVYRASIGAAYLYDGAFFGMLGEFAPTQMLPNFAVHAVVGASLASEASVYDEWCRVTHRAFEEPPGVILFEKDQIERSLAFGPDSLQIDLASLSPGVDFSVAYGAFLAFPEYLRKGMPVVHQHLFGKVFGGKAERSPDASVITRIVRA